MRQLQCARPSAQFRIWAECRARMCIQGEQNLLPGSVCQRFVCMPNTACAPRLVGNMLQTFMAKTFVFLLKAWLFLLLACAYS